MDPVLRGLLDELRSGVADPEAAVRALADHLPDVPPADRVEALRELTFATRALRTAAGLLRSERAVFSCRREVSEDSALTDDYVLARLTGEAGRALLRSIDADRRYAVCFRVRSEEERPEWFRRAPGPSYRLMTLDLLVDSLDGGAVRTIKNHLG